MEHRKTLTWPDDEGAHMSERPSPEERRKLREARQKAKDTQSKAAPGQARGKKDKKKK